MFCTEKEKFITLIKLIPRSYSFLFTLTIAFIAIFDY